jgi:hypothetical protein
LCAGNSNLVLAKKHLSLGFHWRRDHADKCEATRRIAIGRDAARASPLNGLVEVHCGSDWAALKGVSKMMVDTVEKRYP